MSNGNDKQQPSQQGAGPIKVKALHFFVPEGVLLTALRSCEGTIKEIKAGKHPSKPWTIEIVREPWHRMYRVTETEDPDPGPRWPKVRVCLIPESAASYVPEAP